MAQFVQVDIDIDGKKINQYSSLTLSQDIFAHHSFRLVCPAEAIDGTSGEIMHSSKNVMGASINIKINAVGSRGEIQFYGLVTQVEASRRSGHAGDIIITGFSPTILLDSGPHCKTWEDKKIKDIADDVLKHFPQNLLQPKINPVYTESLVYTVQYKETAWQFLCRLYATYGEWFYYDGSKLIAGPPKGKTEELVYGTDISSFNVALQVRPAAFQAMAYDYVNSDVYTGTPASVADKAGLNDLGKHALQKSEKFYATKPKIWYNSFLTTKKQLDDFVGTRAAVQSSNMVRFSGRSGCPQVQIGSAISIQGKNLFNARDESFGEYTAVSVCHYCDGQGNYSNEFAAIPNTVKMPPAKIYGSPHCETQSAVVTDNNDPDGLGRVRVKFHWMNGSEKSPWMRVTTPHAGDGKGMFFIPEINEEVIVGFEGDSAEKPYVIGSVYNSKAKNSFANGGNDVKTFQSRSGNKMVLDDKAGSVFIEDKDGNSMKMDGAGKIDVVSKESIKFTCGDSSIELKKDGTIEVLGKKFVKVKSAQQVSVLSDQVLYVKGKSAVHLMSETKIDAGAPQIEQTADAQYKVSSAMIQIEGQTMTDIKGGTVQLNC